MMGKGVITYAIAGLIAAASLAGAVYSIVMQVSEAALIARTNTGLLVPIPDGILPPETPLPPRRQESLSATDRNALSEAMWRDPLDPKLLNLIYVNDVRTERPVARLNQEARLLGALGWRNTAAQYNLLIRAILNQNYKEVVNRTDALLRRQKLPALSFALLGTMESIPQVHQNVVDKLRGNPRWRLEYLASINPGSGPELLRARAATIDQLMRSRSGISREEVAPSLNAMVGAGQGRVAHALWKRISPEAATDNLVYDPKFKRAAAMSGKQDLGIAFEWRFGQALGFSAEASSEGAIISWDRRGVPSFLQQYVPLAGGRRHTLVLRGRSDSGDFKALFAPTITCGTSMIPFSLRGSNRDEAYYRTSAVPAGCDGGLLTIGGGVDTGTGNVTIELFEVTLKSQ